VKELPYGFKKHGANGTQNVICTSTFYKYHQKILIESIGNKLTHCAKTKCVVCIGMTDEACVLCDKASFDFVVCDLVGVTVS